MREQISKLSVFVALLAFGTVTAAPSAAQQTLPAAKSSGMTIYESFEGSSGSGTNVFDLNSAVGYDFNRHWGADLGLPIYFVTPPSTLKGFASQSNGIGNVYMDVRFRFDNPILDFHSTIGLTAPTGSTTKGFSTGHVTYTWDNNFSRSIGRFAPFVDLEVGDSLNSTSSPQRRIIHRPFITFGNEAQFQAGTDMDVLGPLSVTADVYKVLPWGPQTIYSRILKKGVNTGKRAKNHRVYEVVSTTKGGAALVQDDGIDFAADVALRHSIQIEAGYDYSMHYAAGTLFFSVGFEMTGLFHRGPGKF
jgi:hypothetical protein